MVLNLWALDFRNVSCVPTSPYSLMRQDSLRGLNLSNCPFLKLENTSDRVGFLSWVAEFSYEYDEKKSKWLLSFLPDEKRRFLFHFVLFCFPNLYHENLVGFLELKHMNV